MKPITLFFAYLINLSGYSVLNVSTLTTISHCLKKKKILHWPQHHCLRYIIISTILIKKRYIIIVWCLLRGLSATLWQIIIARWRHKNMSNSRKSCFRCTWLVKSLLDMPIATERGNPRTQWSKIKQLVSHMCTKYLS